MSPNRDLLLRSALLVVVALTALILANAAASLHQVWQLRPGALMPTPWTALLGSNQVTLRSKNLSLLGAALLAGASLSCLIFLVERLLREGWAWVQERLRR